MSSGKITTYSFIIMAENPAKLSIPDFTLNTCEQHKGTNIMLKENFSVRNVVKFYFYRCSVGHSFANSLIVELAFNSASYSCFSKFRNC